MAILPNVPGLTCLIWLDDRARPEYKDEDEASGPRTTTKYIEAVNDSRFSVVTSFDAAAFAYPNDDIQLYFYMDGQLACYKCYSPEDISIANKRHWLEWVYETKDDRVFKKHFKFAELSLSENLPDEDLVGKLGDLGTIKIVFFRIRYGAVDAKASGSFKPLLENDTVPERNLKGRAVSHQARLDENVELLQGSSWKQDKRQQIRLEEDPIAVFHFKYRSAAALRALQLLPRSTSPVPLEDKDVDDLTVEEMRELLRRRKTLREQAPSVTNIKQEFKRERIEDADDADHGSIESGELQPRKRLQASPTVKIEVVDLCDDE